MAVVDVADGKEKAALIIFVRKPELGKVKTRLAATLGNEAALYIYRKLLRHTAAVAGSVDADVMVFYAGEVAEGDDWDVIAHSKRIQAASDLGGRMQAAFSEVFNEGYRSAVIIGSDCPHLTAGHIDRAFLALQEKDVVIGPARDGGYYLLGLHNVHPALFRNIPWSTETVYRQTMSVIQSEGLSVHSLDVLTDVDEEKDLPPEWKREVEGLQPSGNNG